MIDWQTILSGAALALTGWVATEQISINRKVREHEAYAQDIEYIRTRVDKIYDHLIGRGRSI